MPHTKNHFCWTPRKRQSTKQGLPPLIKLFAWKRNVARSFIWFAILCFNMTATTSDCKVLLFDEKTTKVVAPLFHHVLEAVCHCHQRTRASCLSSMISKHWPVLIDYGSLLLLHVNGSLEWKACLDLGLALCSATTYITFWSSNLTKCADQCSVVETRVALCPSTDRDWLGLFETKARRAINIATRAKSNTSTGQRSVFVCFLLYRHTSKF